MLNLIRNCLIVAGITSVCMLALISIVFDPKELAKPSPLAIRYVPLQPLDVALAIGFMVGACMFGVLVQELPKPTPRCSKCRSQDDFILVHSREIRQRKVTKFVPEKEKMPQGTLKGFGRNEWKTGNKWGSFVENTESTMEWTYECPHCHYRWVEVTKSTL